MVIFFTPTNKAYSQQKKKAREHLIARGTGKREF